jgi:cobalamin-dependent methionine synthase I
MQQHKLVKIQSIIRGWLFRKEQGLTSANLLNLKCHNEFKPPRSQLDYYMENNASKHILSYVSLQGKTFGEKYMEQIAKEYFKLDNRNSSTHDHSKLNKTIEQKSARYHANGDDWKWQHIEMSHEWDYLLLCGLDFKDIKFYIGSRKVVETLITDGIIVGQGKKIDGIAQPQQAYWFSRSDFRKKNKKFTDFFVPVKNEYYLIKYLNSF